MRLGPELKTERPFDSVAAWWVKARSAGSALDWWQRLFRTRLWRHGNSSVVGKPAQSKTGETLLPQTLSKLHDHIVHTGTLFFIFLCKIWSTYTHVYTDMSTAYTMCFQVPFVFLSRPKNASKSRSVCFKNVSESRDISLKKNACAIHAFCLWSLALSVSATFSTSPTDLFRRICY